MTPDMAAHHLLVLAAEVGKSYWRLFYGLGLCLFLELAWPRETFTLSRRLGALRYWLLFGAIVYSFTGILVSALRHIPLPPLISLNLTQQPSNPVLRILVLGAAPVLAIVIGDFFGYWYHRLMHGVAPLWRLHRLHHSLPDINAVNSVSHIGDGMLQSLFVTLSLTFVARPVLDAEATPLWITVLLAMHGFYSHSTTRLNLGRLRCLVADNVYHRIHHATDAQHFNCNFANFTPLWDVIFGTAHFPAPDDWPKTGLSDLSPPLTLREFLLQPFQRTTKRNSL